MRAPGWPLDGVTAGSDSNAAGSIHLSGVTAGYGGPPVFRHLDLDVDPGEFLYLVGPSGSGKSTLLKLMHGGLRPLAGSVFVDGFALHSLRRSQLPRVRRQIGHVFQTYELLPYLNTLDNVLLPLQLSHPRLRNPRAYALDALELVGLADQVKQRSDTLSSGEQQRVAVARAIASQPSVLLADEPTGNLDSQSSGEIVELFRQLNGMGSTVVMATHDEFVLGRYPARAIRLGPQALEEAS
jgi:cell division transport system ATP-binding protein